MRNAHVLRGLSAYIGDYGSRDPNEPIAVGSLFICLIINQNYRNYEKDYCSIAAMLR